MAIYTRLVVALCLASTSSEVLTSCPEPGGECDAIAPVSLLQAGFELHSLKAPALHDSQASPSHHRRKVALPLTTPRALKVPISHAAHNLHSKHTKKELPVTVNEGILEQDIRFSNACLMAGKLTALVMCIIHISRSLPILCPFMVDQRAGSFEFAYKWSPTLGVKNAAGLMLCTGLFDLSCGIMLFFVMLPLAGITQVGPYSTSEIAACGTVMSAALFTMLVVLIDGLLIKLLAAISYSGVVLRIIMERHVFATLPMMFTGAFMFGVLFSYLPLALSKMPAGLEEKAEPVLLPDDNAQMVEQHQSSNTDTNCSAPSQRELAGN